MGGQRIQQNSGNKTRATRIYSENFVVTICFRNLEILKKLETNPLLSRDLAGYKNPDPSSPSCLEKLSSSNAIRAQMDLYHYLFMYCTSCDFTFFVGNEAYHIAVHQLI